MSDQELIAVIGLGYIGLPLATAFGAIRPVVGYDVDLRRIEALRQGIDETGEISSKELAAATLLSFTSEPDQISAASIFIVTVPTPVDARQRPDLSALAAASECVGRLLKKGDLVIYESTVFPGTTEDVCVPILVATSGLTFNADFTCGYSPERINPGDRAHRIRDICKVTAGSTPQAARRVEALYQSVIPAGTHAASSIRVAEAAKIIENIQRDVNIALVNELAVIFNGLGIDTHAVLSAAATKWNFQYFAPGLVGGHCIGVDSLYFMHEAAAAGLSTPLITTGRKVNDAMPHYVVTRLIAALRAGSMEPSRSRILVLGITFKENVRDLRNTRVVDVVGGLKAAGATVDVHDPLASPVETWRHIGIRLITAPMMGAYEAVVLAVPHATFLKYGASSLRRYGIEGHVFFDVKNSFPGETGSLRL